MGRWPKPTYQLPPQVPEIGSGSSIQPKPWVQADVLELWAKGHPFPLWACSADRMWACSYWICLVHPKGKGCLRMKPRQKKQNQETETGSRCHCMCTGLCPCLALSDPDLVMCEPTNPPQWLGHVEFLSVTTKNSCQKQEPKSFYVNVWIWLNTP